MAKVLLIEPDYRNKYPPLGLMKISTYHKTLGDEVVFHKGKNTDLRAEKWDRIYISTLFTFYWKKTVETIKYYMNSVKSPEDIYVGGIMATILYNEMIEEEGLSEINIIRGLLDKPGILGDNDIIVDTLTPDYSIIEPNETQTYRYPVDDAYIVYSTRGCVNRCEFCAVPELEPVYKDYISIKDQVDNIKESSGEKRDLLFLDNNVLASKEFNKIIDEIIDLGYRKGENKFTYINKKGRKISKRKYVDFNQGVDARLINDENMSLLSKVAIRPLRIAFDHADDRYVKIYTDAVRLAVKHGIKDLSNYVLFNFKDKPGDFYKRLRINVDLNEEFEKDEETRGAKIFSFPMRYSPLKGPHSKDRKYIGKYWTPKYIRAIQCVLVATRGVVGPKKNFFLRAFGKNQNEFKKILIMPEDYIINREENEISGNTDEWWSAYTSLEDKSKVLQIINLNKFRDIELYSYSKKEKELLIHYIPKKKR
ncbi:conserved hypothetical protein [[Clostridium] ultunense Esp]|uniref:Radical SAM core domain-containing protein n=1 Tax=[Clostridium] ultunense Esp TaxID=1288971 RepID=M1ZKR7_9FIRM|nr:radical SAM protein [Schnuerera ultunensis]CCQ95922.1 conserved hypothetical protein [[Clostridium] ultunense Esp]SHD76815.1 conserved protein of unknown function [[Clostridium] ultunense Esp]